MRIMERNKTPFHYALYLGRVPIVDENGKKTGERTPSYGTVVSMKANVSPATGYTQTELFGTTDQYDKVILTDDLSCPITENTVLFIDKSPEYDSEGVPQYDYVVRRVAKSLNVLAYAVSKVQSK